MNTNNENALKDLPEMFREVMYTHQAELQLVVADRALPTAKDAAVYCQLPDSAVIKTLLLKTSSGTYAAVVMRGCDSMDQKKVRKHLGVKKFRFLNGDEVLNITEFAPGGVPPVGLPEHLTLCVDENVMKEEFIIGGGGKPELLIKTSPSKLVSITGAQISEFSE
ncbi:MULTISPECIES: aminoacyl-tRNA deacylase [Pseudoalteromonas]|uniref:YbaK/aminoacyl-tRNA synthetase-associated domain-containing protein n=1 Tax=Pseudoalteromonas amylolytica TaxID=1859457 RepID=A0A1S1MTB1_9GAMM|nr:MULTISPECIES: YbaK/EbsC family protein [Pseudoalteromonas]MCF6436505.1 YbaK/EbsC family protein [Pseudoalteromonas sp. MMG022]OHU86147.1 hypothetical protein BFC16_15670 [Pseudoalteromonas sp. JW3]OHU89746.1 hypothetical protein BET10_16645 [Pseudoalteromonas amylolytica]